MTNDELRIVQAARKWVGTKFHHQGRKKNIGVDCIGLWVGVAREIGLSVDDELDYPREPNGGRLELALEEYLVESELKIGGVGLFKIKNEPQHVGIFSDYGDDIGLIHAYAQARKVAEHRLDDFWRDKLVRCFEFPMI